MVKNSFSLLETLVSVVILAILTSAVAGVFSYQNKTLENMNNIQNAYNSFYLSSDILSIDTKELVISKIYNDEHTNTHTYDFKTNIYNKDGIYLYRIKND
ncbi:type II secretion system protein [Arcobacter sp. FWKO B]|uniref:type II secretion system protein n=1 Tax=Arcobacter sp. FWKO B TaxID=2593672 RepID=UPI00190589FC|nr:type II secretion system protein [Arcobacter sp. FWKO B]